MKLKLNPKMKMIRMTALGMALCLLPMGGFPLGRIAGKPKMKQKERNTLSIALEFTRKRLSSLKRVIMPLAGIEPNGYATGFIVGDNLVLTTFHVVSGKLPREKKKLLGFKPDEELDVKVYVKGCEAKIVKVDEVADLALLSVCRTSSKPVAPPVFQTAPRLDEQLVLIAQPSNNFRLIRRGKFSGSYTFRGQQFWSVRIDGQDGCSGSPLYNDQGEVVGVFIGYDSVRELAIISPGVKVEKFLADYSSGF